MSNNWTKVKTKSKKYYVDREKLQFEAMVLDKVSNEIADEVNKKIMEKLENEIK